MDFPKDSDGCKQPGRRVPLQFVTDCGTDRRGYWLFLGDCPEDAGNCPMSRLAALFPGDCSTFPDCLLLAVEKQPRDGEPSDQLWDVTPDAGDRRACTAADVLRLNPFTFLVDTAPLGDITRGHAYTFGARFKIPTIDNLVRGLMAIGDPDDNSSPGTKLEVRVLDEGNGPKLQVVVQNGGIQSNEDIPENQWFDLQIVVPTGGHMTDIKVYVDGVPLTWNIFAGADRLLDLAGQTLRLGGLLGSYNPSRPWVQHIKLWDYALTEAQLADVRAYRHDWWPIGDWPAEESEGKIFYNRAANAAHLETTSDAVAWEDDTEHATPLQYNNVFGWTDGAGRLKIPAAAWDPTKDALGGDLTYKGRCPRDATLNADGTINFRGYGAEKNTGWWRYLDPPLPSSFDPASDSLPYVSEDETHWFIADCSFPEFFSNRQTAAPHPTAVIVAPSSVQVDTPFSLAATGSTGTPDDPVVSYHWEFGDGQGGSGAAVQHTYTSEGQKTVKLTVVTQQGRTATAQATINVTSAAPNLPPVAVINGPDSVPQGNSANFQAAGSSDPDGTIAGYEWTLPDGSKSTNLLVSYVFNDLGDQTLTLTVTDNEGATGTTTKTVTVTPPANQPPVVTIEGAEAVDVGESQMYLAQAGDSDGTIAGYEWTLPDGSTQTGPLITYEFKAPSGEQTISVTVTDNDGATATATKTVTVAPPNQPPTAVITGPDEIVIGTSHTYNALGSSDPDGSIASYEWTFPDGSTENTPSAAYTFLGPAGDQTVTLTVTDNDGATDTTTKTVNVLARPIVSISWPTNDVTVGQPLTLDASGSSSPNGDVTCTWNFGDGSPEATGCVQTHTWAHEGSYTVTLTVTDEKGATNVSTSHLSVVAPASGDPPDAQIWGADMVVPGESWTWDATDSTDSDGTIAATSWEIQPDGVTGSDEAITFTPDDTGERTITLTVRDNDGNETQDTKTVQVVQHFPDFDGNTWQEPAAPRFWTNLNNSAHSMGFWPRRFEAMGIPLHTVHFYNNEAHKVPRPVDPPYNWHLIRQTVLDFNVPGTSLRAIDIEEWHRTTAKLPDHKRIIKEIRAAWADGDKKSPLVAYGHGWMNGMGEINGISYNPPINAMQMRRIDGSQNSVAVPGYKGAILTAEYYHPFVANEFFYLTPTLYCNQQFYTWQEFVVQAMDYLWTRNPGAKIVPWVSIKNYSTNTWLTNDECREAGLMWRAMRHRLHGLICFNAMNSSNPTPPDETIVDTFIQAYLTG